MLPKRPRKILGKITMPVNRKRKGSRPDNVATAKKAKVAINPFEVRRNRKKHDVIGQKSARDSIGRPGLSRSKAIDKVSTHELQIIV